MALPKLDPVKDKDYESYYDKYRRHVPKVVTQWLFGDSVSIRAIDRDILGKDPDKSHGWESTSVLHFLGLKKPFKQLFKGMDVLSGIDELEADPQNVDSIVLLLEEALFASGDELLDKRITERLEEACKNENPEFERHYEQILSSLDSTDKLGGSSLSRREQSILRARLFADKTQAQCAVCHRSLPTNLLVAAHIKPRRNCRLVERKNPNIVLPLCKIGCDDFFERGYILVDMNGEANINDESPMTTDLQGALASIEGKVCTYFNPSTEAFFADKLESIKELSKK